MLKTERREALVALCNKSGAVTVKMAAQTLGVSTVTIRRDFEELDAEGRLERVHGGARRLSSDEDRGVETPYSRMRESGVLVAEKSEIACRAAGLVKTQDTIFLGASTTVELMVPFLPKSGIRVITNSFHIFSSLEQERDTDWELSLLGGIYRRGSGAFVGPMAEKILVDIGIDKAFIGANGIVGNSVYTSSIDEGKLQQIALQQSDHRFIVSDSTKLGHRGFFYSFYTLDQCEALITDSNISRNYLDSAKRFTEVLM